jgi:hypothetical protein
MRPAGRTESDEGNRAERDGSVARVVAQLPWLGHLVKWKTGFGAVGIVLLMLYVALYAGARRAPPRPLPVKNGEGRLPATASGRREKFRNFLSEKRKEC